MCYDLIDDVIVTESVARSLESSKFTKVTAFLDVQFRGCDVILGYHSGGLSIIIRGPYLNFDRLESFLCPVDDFMNVHSLLLQTIP